MERPPILVRVLWFYVGLTVVTMGYSLIIKAAVGAAPWDIFHLGVQGKLGIPLAFIIQGTGVVIILLNMLLGITPTLGMLLNMLSVGPMVQFTLSVLPLPETIALRWLMLAAGLFLSGQGTALYVSADVGSGPRDGMMIGLTRKLGISVGLIKNAIDITVTTLGWWLGGPLGLGTIAVAFGLGPSIQFGMRCVVWLSKQPFFRGFVRPVPLKQAPAKAEA